MSEQETTAAAEAKTNKVKMTDGREVEFGEKTKMKKDYGFEAETGLVWCRLDFANGEVVETKVDPNSEIGRQALGHGLAQKLGDAAAGAESVDDALEAVIEVAKRIAAGEWAKAREGGGSAKGASELVQALVVVLGKDKDVIRTMLSGLNAAEKMALRKVPEVGAEIEKIKAAKAPSKAEQEKVQQGAGLLDALRKAAA